MKGSLKIVGGLMVVLLALGVGWLLGTTGTGRAADPASLTDLEREFTERMQNVALEGHFTIEGVERRDGNPELYEIASVTKLDGDDWRFDVRVVYGSVDVTLPVVVPMVWAGDTPMVSITDFAIPGLGGAVCCKSWAWRSCMSQFLRVHACGGLVPWRVC